MKVYIVKAYMVGGYDESDDRAIVAPLTPLACATMLNAVKYTSRVEEFVGDTVSVVRMRHRFVHVEAVLVGDVMLLEDLDEGGEFLYEEAVVTDISAEAYRDLPGLRGGADVVSVNGSVYLAFDNGHRTYEGGHAVPLLDLARGLR